MAARAAIAVATAGGCLVDKAIEATLRNLISGERFVDVALLMESCPSDAAHMLDEVRRSTEAEDFEREIGPMELDATLSGDALLVSEKWTVVVREGSGTLLWKVGLPGVDLNALIVDGTDESYHFLEGKRSSGATIAPWGPETELHFPELSLGPGRHSIRMDYHASLKDSVCFRETASGARLLSWWAVSPSVTVPVYDLKIHFSTPGGRFLQSNPPGRTRGPRYEFRSAFTKPREGRKLDILLMKK
jgi:hypothetical protein